MVEFRPLLSRRRLLAAWPLVLTWTVIIFIWRAYPHAYDFHDPLAYAHIAHQINQGTFVAASQNHPFFQRIGLTIPVAAIYAVWGVSPRLTNLVPLLATLGMATCVWLALPDARSRFFGLLISATSVPLLSAGTALFPDAAASALMNGSVVVLYHRRHLAARTPWLAGSLGAGIWVLAFLAKESACWTLPIWLVCAIADVRTRQRELGHFYLSACGVGLALGALYLCCCYWLFGDALARFSGIEALADVHSWSIQDSQRLSTRLLETPFTFFSDEYGALCVLTLCAPLVLSREQRFWAYCALWYIAVFWFGSASLGKYRPLPLYSRMALPCAPSIYIVSAALMSSLAQKALIRHATLLAALVLLTLSFAPLRSYVQSWERDPEQRAMRYVRHEARDKPQERVLLVCSDELSAAYIDVYFSFEPPANVGIVSAGALDDVALNAADVVYFYVNRPRSRFYQRATKRPHYDEEVRAAPLQRLMAKDGVELYRGTRPLGLTTSGLRSPG